MKKLLILSLTCMLTIKAMDNSHDKLNNQNKITPDELFVFHRLHANKFNFSYSENNQFAIDECVEFLRSSGKKEIGVIAHYSDPKFHKVNILPIKLDRVAHQILKPEEIGKVNNFNEINRLVAIKNGLYKLHKNSPKSFKLEFSKKHTFDIGEFVVCKQEKKFFLTEINDKLNDEYVINWLGLTCDTKKIGKIKNINELKDKLSNN